MKLRKKTIGETNHQQWEQDLLLQGLSNLEHIASGSTKTRLTYLAQREGTGSATHTYICPELDVATDTEEVGEQAVFDLLEVCALTLGSISSKKILNKMLKKSAERFQEGQDEWRGFELNGEITSKTLEKYRVSKCLHHPHAERLTHI